MAALLVKGMYTLKTPEDEFFEIWQIEMMRSFVWRDKIHCHDPWQMILIQP